MKKNLNYDELLDRALSSPPDYHLKESFTEDVLRKIERTKSAEERRMAYLLTGSLLAFVLISLVGLFIFVPLGTLLQMREVGVWAAITGSLVAIFQTIDRKLVSKPLI